MTIDLHQLPHGLAAPVDDGAASHLVGRPLPDIALINTAGEPVMLDGIMGRCVIYIYPMTGRPDVALPKQWDTIPGARGCTPQSCGFRDHHAELRALNTRVFGLSSQSSAYQREARDRLHLPFELLSDPNLLLKSALRLPTFTVEGVERYKRLTLIANNGTIRKVYYPVFPPDLNAQEVIDWLRNDAAQAIS